MSCHLQRVGVQKQETGNHLFLYFIFFSKQDLRSFGGRGATLVGHPPPYWDALFFWDRVKSARRPVRWLGRVRRWSSPLPRLRATAAAHSPEGAAAPASPPTPALAAAPLTPQRLLGVAYDVYADARPAPADRPAADDPPRPREAAYAWPLPRRSGGPPPQTVVWLRE